jgi:hypothetical protein
VRRRDRPGRLAAGLEQWTKHPSLHGGGITYLSLIFFRYSGHIVSGPLRTASAVGLTDDRGPFHGLLWLVVSVVVHG